MNTAEYQCHSGCGACCIAPQIASSIPSMPNGKPAGQRCVQLDSSNRCRLFGMATRPAVCEAFKASAEICGQGAEQALQILTVLEQQTQP